MNPPEKPRKKFQSYLRYSSLGFEILAYILIFVAIGYFLDKWANTDKPYFVLVFSLLGCGAVMYKLIRTLGKPRK